MRPDWPSTQAIKATGGNLNNADTATYVAYILHHQRARIGKPRISWTTF